MRRVLIDPVTRLEGHGRIEILLDGAGDVAEAFFVVPELRGFERFCAGRRVEDLPILTSRICGICPEAHLLASAKALDDLYGLVPPPAAAKIRELFHMAFFVADHATHFYFLGGPDLLVGPDAPPAERNFLGVIRKVGNEAGREVLAARARSQEAVRILGGRSVHPVAAVAGGWSRPVREEERRAVAAAAEANVEFARRTLDLFDREVRGSASFEELLASDAWVHRTYSMATVDEGGRLALAGGRVRVVDPDGAPFALFEPREYREHVEERVEPWSYLKFPYLRRVGWKGLVDGAGSGVYTATPLARLNAADGLSTPLAQAERDRFFHVLGTGRSDGRDRPVHHRMATHWARLVEMLHAAERMDELARDGELCDPRVRSLPEGGGKGAGVGSLEAPRGTLFHHYEADERGVATRVNLVVGTTNNHAAIAMSVRRAAEALIRGGRVEEGLLNRVEMAFRLYDPCFSCATHSLPGRMPLAVTVRSADGAVVRALRRDP